MYILYRIADNEIVGTSDRESRIAEDIQNVVQSEGYGGFPSDYASTLATVVLGPGEMFQVVNGQLGAAMDMEAKMI